MAQAVKNLPAVQETRVLSLGWEDPREKEMATHSSILVWRIPRTEEPGGLQSMGLQKSQIRLKRLSMHTHTHDASPSSQSGFPVPTPRPRLICFLCMGCAQSKEPICKAGDAGSIPGWGRPPGGGHGKPLQHSCLENPTDRGAWRATVHGVTKSRTGRIDSAVAHTACFV